MTVAVHVTNIFNFYTFIPHLAVICLISSDFSSIIMAPGCEDKGADMDSTCCQGKVTYSTTYFFTETFLACYLCYLPTLFPSNVLNISFFKKSKIRPLLKRLVQSDKCPSL